MKTLKICTSILMLSALVLFSSTTFARSHMDSDLICQVANAEANSPNLITETEAAKKPQTCTVSGPDDYMCGWLSEMDAALDCCEEGLPQMGVDCQYWGSSYQYQSWSYSFSTMIQYDAAYVNNWVSSMCNTININRPTPSGNWMIYAIFLNTALCGSGSCCMELEATYRKIICTQRN